MSLVKDDKQQSSDSIAAAPAVFVALLLASVNSDSYPLRTLSCYWCIRMKTTIAVITRLGAEKAAGLLLMFMQSSLLAMSSYYCAIYFRCSYKSSGNSTDPRVSIR
jgi:hypothetical protein